VGDVPRISGKLRVVVYDPWAQRIANAPLEQMPQISWGERCSENYLQGAVFSSDEADEYGGDPLGCPLLLQTWIHERFDIGRPRTDLSEYEPPADGTDPADLPTMGSLWCLWKAMTSLYVILRVMTFVVPFT
jgi:hypothetical protein